MMEIERLKALKEEEAREVRKHEARKKGAQVIVDQIQERTVQRILSPLNLIDFSLRV